MRYTTDLSKHMTDLSANQDDFLQDALVGLSARQKSIPAKYFYDEHGSELFEEITKLDEYYQTRTEIQILQDHCKQIEELIGKEADLIELGSGSSMKTHILIDSIHLQSYVPIDISKKMLRSSVNTLQTNYPNLHVHGIAADYTKPFSLPKLGANKKVIFFPGSTIGNFEPFEAALFLRQWAKKLKKGDGLLIGVDLRKDTSMLEAAYNDKKGITAAFNKHLLTRLNRELQTDFQHNQFYHHAFFNHHKSRIEMHLISKTAQSIQLADRNIYFHKEESIHTENSYKYSVHSFQQLCLSCGFEPVTFFLDKNEWFSVHYAEVI